MIDELEFRKSWSFFPTGVSVLAVKNKDNNFNQFLSELKDEYNTSLSDFFTVFESLADENELKLPRYFINYGKTKEQIITQLSLQSEDSIKRVTRPLCCC